MKLNNDLYEYDKAAALLAILDILRRFGDDHNKREMQEKLLEEYGISLSRNTFAAKLKTLDRCGYTLSESADGSHYVFEGREFSDAQLRVLIDCLIYNGVVGSETAKKMIAELCDLGSESLRNKCGSFQKLIAGRKRSSDAVTENLGLIQSAISGRAKLTYNYKVYNKMLNLVNKYPKDITVSPLELTLSNGRYILICAIDGENDLAHFYIDKLTDIRIKREPACSERKLLSALGYNDMNEYISSQPVLCGGRKERFSLKIDNDIINDFLEDFGGEFRKVLGHKENDGYATVLTVTTSQDSLRRLIMPYFDRITILDRPQFDAEIKEMVETGLHNSRMIGKPARVRSFAARSLEEAIRLCQIEDLNSIEYRSHKIYEKIDLSELKRVDWINRVLFWGVDLRGQRFPDELKGITSLSLIGCKFDAEMITQLKELKDLRITDVTAEQLEAISALENIENIMIDGRARIKDTENSCDIADLSFLKNWSKLKKAELFDLDKLTDISALEDKKGLRLIRIGGCAVSDDAINSLKDKVPSITVYEKTVR
ncbi:MAG: WYL domain-containing protein [Ruminococcus sp.]|nr:WYL domain-containing protein [Ruminococcus sp.]